VLHERADQLSADLTHFKLKEKKSQEFTSSEPYRYSPTPAKTFVHAPDRSDITYHTSEFDMSSDLELSQASATGYLPDFEMPDLQHHPTSVQSPPVTLIMSNYAAYRLKRGKFWVSKPYSIVVFSPVISFVSV
jgi:hypothetical protein